MGVPKVCHVCLSKKETKRTAQIKSTSNLVQTLNGMRHNDKLKSMPYSGSWLFLDKDMLLAVLESFVRLGERERVFVFCKLSTIANETYSFHQIKIGTIHYTLLHIAHCTTPVLPMDQWTVHQDQWDCFRFRPSTWVRSLVSRYERNYPRLYPS